MKIIISEQQLGVIVENTNQIPHLSLIPLENQINELIDKKGKTDPIGALEKNVMDRFVLSLGVDQSSKNITLNIGGQKLTLNRVKQGLFTVKIPSGTSIPIGFRSITLIMDEVKKLGEYKSIQKQIPDIESRIRQTQLKGEIVPNGENGGVIVFKVSKSPEEMNDVKIAVPFGEKYPVGEFYKRNKVITSFKNGTYGVLSCNGVVFRLSSVKILVDPPKSTSEDEKSLTSQKNI